MHSSLSILIGALTLGFVGGAIPGPVLTTIFTEIVETNFLRSMRVLLFAMLVETLVRLFALVLMVGISPSGQVFQALSLVGAVILLRIAFSVWHIRSVSVEGKASFTLPTLALMILCNGMLWTYWLTACVPDAMQLGTLLPYGQYLFLLFFEAGWLVSTFLMACIFSFFKRLLSDPRIMPLLFKFFALVFAGFALRMVISSVRFFSTFWST